MMVVYEFGVSLREYALRGKANVFPVLEVCPNCQCFGAGYVKRHGFYWRNAITEEQEYRVPICRFRCSACRVTISVLPDFLVPYFQHVLETVLGRVQERLEGRVHSGSRQLGHFYKRRFLKNLNWIHSFFMDEGERTGLSSDDIKEAKKYLSSILDFGESPFLRRSWGHLNKYLLAN